MGAGQWGNYNTTKDLLTGGKSIIDNLLLNELKSVRPFKAVLSDLSEDELDWITNYIHLRFLTDTLHINAPGLESEISEYKQVFDNFISMVIGKDVFEKRLVKFGKVINALDKTKFNFLNKDLVKNAFDEYMINDPSLKDDFPLVNNNDKQLYTGAPSIDFYLENLNEAEIEQLGQEINKIIMDNGKKVIDSQSVMLKAIKNLSAVDYQAVFATEVEGLASELFESYKNDALLNNLFDKIRGVFKEELSDFKKLHNNAPDNFLRRNEDYYFNVISDYFAAKLTYNALNGINVVDKFDFLDKHLDDNHYQTFSGFINVFSAYCVAAESANKSVVNAAEDLSKVYDFLKSLC